MNTNMLLVPNDNPDNENAAVFRVFVDQSCAGNRGAARTCGDTPREYLRVRPDDPRLPELATLPRPGPLDVSLEIHTRIGNITDARVEVPTCSETS